MEADDPYPEGLQAFILPLFLLVFTPGIAAAIFLLLLLLLSSALVSGSEIAYFSLSPSETESIREENSPKSKRLLSLKEKPRNLLATILISNNFINIGIVILSDFILKKTIPDEVFENLALKIQNLGMFQSSTLQDLGGAVNFLITVVVVTFLLVLFGEIAPKIYAKLNNIKLAKIMAGPLTFLSGIFYPLSRLLVSWSNGLEGRLNSSGNSLSDIQKDEIDTAIDLALEDAPDSAEEADILKSIIKFSDVPVKQVMTNRTDVVGLELEMDQNDVLNLIKKSGYSRIPVYEEDFDNVKGILYVKDLVLNENKKQSWQELVRTNVLYIPESKKINDLMKEFQKERMHMGIVVDEYGGSSGVVTLEDVMEEVVGEIKDEFDGEDDSDFTKIDMHNFIFEGKTLLNDVCRISGMDTNSFDEVRGDADSVAGLFLEHYGTIPNKNEEVYAGPFLLKVIAVNKKRVEKVKITLPKTDD